MVFYLSTCLSVWHHEDRNEDRQYLFKILPTTRNTVILIPSSCKLLYETHID